MQSFGIPVSSMSKLLQYLDQAVAHDPQTLEQNIMDKSEHPGQGSARAAASDPACWSRGGMGLCGRRGEEPSSLTPRHPRGVPADYMAHLVEVQHERGASGGQTFHSLLTASLPARRGTRTRPSPRARPPGCICPRAPVLAGSVLRRPREPWRELSVGPVSCFSVGGWLWLAGSP